MPIIGSDENEFSTELANELIQRYNWDSGIFYDSSYGNEPSWLVSTSGFNRWFELIQENLELNLGRRLAHAAADSEELRLDLMLRPNGFFNLTKKSILKINEDWRLRGLGSLKVPSKSSKLEKLDLEVHGRLQSSFSSGLANAAWEWVVKKRHRFRWEDSGKNIALVHLELDNLDVAKPKKINFDWLIDSDMKVNHIQGNPLSKPYELEYGGWELMGERHVMLSRDFIIRLVDNITTYATECSKTPIVIDWSIFKLKDTETMVWDAIAKSSSDLFREGEELFMVAQPENWVDASQAELAEHGLGSIHSSKGIDKVGGIELSFSKIFHPAIVTGILMGCWSRSEGRNAKAEWIELDGQRRLRISSKSEIANS